MHIKYLSATDRDKWDAFLTKEGSFALLQSWDWGVFKEQLGWKVWRIAVEDNGSLIAGAQLLVKPLPLGLSIAYIPRGPVGRWLDAEVALLLLTELNCIAKKNGAIFLKIEPAIKSDTHAKSTLERYGFQRSRINNQPQNTILLDLTRDEDDILLQMRKKTRQYIGRAEREGVSVKFGDMSHLPVYYSLMRQTSRREHFAARSDLYYQTEWETFSADHRAVLLLAYYQDRVIAVRAIFRFGSHAAEFHAGSVDIPGVHANYRLVWEAIKWAKAQGCETYDLWGIPDELIIENDDDVSKPTGRSDGLWGVYQFKRGFSKQVVSYIGAYDYVYLPMFYFQFNSGLFDNWWERLASVMDSLKFRAHKEHLSHGGGK